MPNIQHDLRSLCFNPALFYLCLYVVLNWKLDHRNEVVRVENELLSGAIMRGVSASGPRYCYTCSPGSD